MHHRKGSMPSSLSNISQLNCSSSVLCGQWVASHRCMKRHYQYSRKQLLDDLGLDIKRLIDRTATACPTCHYCHVQCKGWRSHVQKRTVVWQCAIMHLVQEGRRIVRILRGEPLRSATTAAGRTQPLEKAATRNNRIRIRSAAAPGPKLVDYFSQTRHQVGGGDQGPQAGPCIGCFPTTGRAQRIASSLPNSKGVSGQATKQSRLDSRPKAPQNGHGHCSVPGIGGALGAQMSGRGLGNFGWRDPATGWNFQRWNGTLKCLEEDSPLRIRWRLHSF